MRLFVFILLSLHSANLIAQHYEPVQLPKQGDNIVFSFQRQFPGKSDRFLFNELVDRLKLDTTFSSIKINTDSLRIKAKGRYFIPTKRQRTAVNYSMFIHFIGDTVMVRYHQFYLDEIGASLEEVLQKNENTMREEVRENLWFLTAGLQSTIHERWKALYTFLEGKLD